MKKAKGSRTRRYAAPRFDLRRFISLIACANPTSYTGRYMRDHSTCQNPALSAGSYNSVDDFRHDYFLYNAVRKYSAGTSKNAASAAIEKFKKVDAALGQRMAQLSWTWLALNEPDAHQILFAASRKILRTIGAAPLFGELARECSFSGGATAMTPRRSSEQPFKYSTEYYEVSPQLLPLARLLVHLSPIWRENVKGFKLCRYNRVTTVPKDKDIDRPIACEPMLNMYLQKGYGSIIRKRLRKVGIDLNDQTVNQRLARKGSLDGSLATIDLSAASDSISIELCRLLLPQDWFDALIMARSDQGLLPDGTILTYNKISSMGNGFTFELESLLFWAISQASQDFHYRSVESKETRTVSVYGDDIICDVSASKVVIDTLAICGFDTNIDKSFVSGPFRESCGEHYFNGTSVTPVYIRNPVVRTTDLFKLGNQLRRWNRRCLGLDDPRYVPAYDYVVSCAPTKWQRPTIPDGVGDGAFYGTLAEVGPTFNNVGTYKAKVLMDVRCYCEDASSSEYANLYSIYYGLGGYIQRLDESKDNSNTSEATFMKHPPLPGTYTLRSMTIELREWSDSNVPVAGNAP